MTQLLIVKDFSGVWIEAGETGYTIYISPVRQSGIRELCGWAVVSIATMLQVQMAASWGNAAWRENATNGTKPQSLQKKIKSFQNINSV